MCTIANNFIGDNAAGIRVETYSNVNSNALYANITNNVIIYTTHGEPLHVQGHYFQVMLHASLFYGIHYDDREIMEKINSPNNLVYIFRLISKQLWKHGKKCKFTKFRKTWKKPWR